MTDNTITSQIKLFADDSVLCRNIRNQNDHVILQNDLDTISSWANKWLMEQNINKCSVLSITPKHNYIFMTMMYLAQRKGGLQIMIILV